MTSSEQAKTKTWVVGERDLDRAGEVLGRAFVDDPMFVAALPDPVERAEMCRALFTANVRHALRYGEVLVAGPSPDEIRGVAYWVAKPEPENSEKESTEFGYAALEERWGAALEMLGGMEAAITAPLSTMGEPWRYLAGIGVDPAYQGHGIGRALVERIVSDARAAGLRVGLATDPVHSARFYERSGFEIVHSVPDMGNGLPGCAMLTTPVKGEGRRVEGSAPATPRSCGTTNG